MWARAMAHRLASPPCMICALRSQQLPTTHHMTTPMPYTSLAVVTCLFSTTSGAVGLGERRMGWSLVANRLGLAATWGHVWRGIVQLAHKEQGAEWWCDWPCSMQNMLMVSFPHTPM